MSSQGGGMPGSLVLIGGAEFLPGMEEADRQALHLAGGMESAVGIIPTAAAPDHNHQRAGRNGVSWFRSLGVQQVEALPIIDRASANDPALAAELGRFQVLYLLGGFTGYLGQTLLGSACWAAALQVYERGGVLAGSSAGAMVLCQYYFDPTTDAIAPGLNLVPQACVLPHHNSFGARWARPVRNLLPQGMLLGLDEQTALSTSVAPFTWQVFGPGRVTIYSPGTLAAQVYRSGQTLSLASGAEPPG